ncbi:unnamed protein product [Bathycoccus prasinos]
MSTFPSPPPFSPLSAKTRTTTTTTTRSGGGFTREQQQQQQQRRRRGGGGGGGQRFWNLTTNLTEKKRSRMHLLRIVSSSTSSSSSSSWAKKRNSLREKHELKKREEEERGQSIKATERRREAKGGKRRQYERELEDALRRQQEQQQQRRRQIRQNAFSSSSLETTRAEVGDERKTTAAAAVKDAKRRVKKALKKAKRFARRNVQKATDVLLPSGSSLGGGRRRGGDGGPVRFTPSTPSSSSSSYYAYRQQQPNIFGLTGAAGAIAGWSMLIGLAYVVVKVMNGERVIPRGGFQLTIPGFRGFNFNKRKNRNEGGKWVIDRSLGGRKVWVPDGEASKRGSKLSERSALDEVYFSSTSSSSPTSTSTSTTSRTFEDEDEEKEQQNLPTWWTESPFLRTSIGGIDKQRKSDLLQDAKRSASFLSAARINGVQWTSDMILDFHTACAAALKCYPYEEKNKYRLSIAKSVGPENARVQLYRQASEIAVEDCVGNRSGVSSSFGMEVNIFVVGLSYFLNIPTKTAINIVRSSCAVKIRNLLLESCSAIRKEREGMSSPSADLLLSLFSIVSVLNVFPFTENSAEIEMINEGFKTRITEKERRELVAAYKQISDGVGDKTIEEALR